MDDGSPGTSTSTPLIAGPRRASFSWRRFLLDGLLLTMNGAVALAAVSFVASALVSLCAGGATTVGFALLIFWLAAPWILIPLLLVVHPAIEFLGRPDRQLTGSTVAVSIVAVVLVPAIGIWFSLYGSLVPTQRVTDPELAGIGPTQAGEEALATFGLYLVFVIPMLGLLLGAFLLLVAAGRTRPVVTVVTAVSVVTIGALLFAIETAPPAPPDSRAPAQVNDAAAEADRIRTEMGRPEGLQQIRVTGRPDGATGSSAQVDLIIGPSTTAAQAHAIADAAIAAATRLGWPDTTTVTIQGAASDIVQPAPTIPAADPTADPTADPMIPADPADPYAQQPPQSETDASPSRQPPWSLQLVPKQVDDLDQALDDLLEVDGLPPGVTTRSVGGWQYVDITDINAFLDVRTSLHSLGTFAKGTTYSVPGERRRLRIVDVPDRMSDAAIAEIVAIAIAHPDAEVLLEAPTAGPQWPTLYISGLNDADAAAVVARLRSPEFVRANVHGYSVEFVIRSGGPGEYLTGTFGDVVE
ncbi:hypothetical protein [Plantibacter sp. YIM 135347]|uniref:hypothetical protein n=1 Tax=Plantibacter sp. YIM 135347 TaxID=3423919 RepID=UPI003D348236